MTTTTDRRLQPQPGEPKEAPRLRVVRLEGRIAPRLAMNHSETLARDGGKAKPGVARPKQAPRPRVVKLEGRVAPTLTSNHNEILVRDRA